jgi:hypothetical protein
MRKLEKNTRRYFVNLFADYILSKFDKKDNTVIQVTDCETFVVVNGQTTSKEVLDLNELKTDFSNWFDDVLTEVNRKNLNIIDIIKYDQEIKNFDNKWISTHKDLYTIEDEPISELTCSSEFPYGHSLGCGRSIVYYSQYMFNHMYSLLNVDQVYLYYTNEENEDGDRKIKVSCNSYIDNDKIESLVLDVFDMDLESFNERFTDYEFFHDVFDQTKNKPYLVQDRLKDITLL